MTVAACLWAAVVFLGVNLQAHMGWPALVRWGYIPSGAIYSGAFWGMVTNAFVHIEPLHLLFNLYWMWILGGALERSIGSVRWILFVLLAAFVSSAISSATEGFGIGLSGVGYALFGFGWMTRRRFPEFARTVTDRTVQLFVAWGLLCVVGTYTKVMNIGNVAHLAGLLFGLAVGGAVEIGRLRALLAAAAAALVALAVGSLVYSPFSEEWNSQKALAAHRSGRLNEAAAYYRRALDLGADPEWAWGNLVRVYGVQNSPEYRPALEELRRYNESEADDLDRIFGSANPPGSP